MSGSTRLRTTLAKPAPPTRMVNSHHSPFQKRGFLKKVIDIKSSNLVYRGWFQERRRILPGRFFVFSEPGEQETKTKRGPGKEENTSMYSLIRLKTLASCVLICIAFLPQMHAAPNALPPPPPDGCYPGFTTAE